MSERIKVSVIIPAYNLENYIARCLDCIINQTLKDIEIICVNDGSTDKTEEIIRSYMEKDKRISIINQENQYAGVARNAGIKASTGTYLVFWDGDDTFELDALQLMYEQLEKEQTDICVCDADRFEDGYDDIYTNVKYIKEAYAPEFTPFSIKDIPQYIFNFTTNVPWNKMFRRKFVVDHNLEFESCKRANDHYFILQAICLASGISLVRKSLIHYRLDTEGSLTSGISENPFYVYEALLHSKEKLEEYGIFEDEQIIQSFANKCANSLVYTLEQQKEWPAYERLYKKLKTDGFDSLYIKDRKDDYYYAKGVSEKLERFFESTPEEYLMKGFVVVGIKEYQTSVKNHQLREDLRELKQEYKVTKKELTWIKNSRGYKILNVFYNLKRKIKGTDKNSTN